MPYESLPPFILIAGMLSVAGGVQYVVNRAVYGKPKHPNSDAWDYAMEARDKRILEEAQAAAKVKNLSNLVICDFVQGLRYFLLQKT